VQVNESSSYFGVAAQHIPLFQAEPLVNNVSGAGSLRCLSYAVSPKAPKYSTPSPKTRAFDLEFYNQPATYAAPASETHE
jgi:hypothetical protein